MALEDYLAEANGAASAHIVNGFPRPDEKLAIFQRLSQHRL